jgi:hypothetical protein
MAKRAINSLADLKDANLVVEEHTLADLILMAYHGGMLVNRITHVRPGPAVFDELEQGEHDATLIELHRLDQYLAATSAKRPVIERSLPLDRFQSGDDRPSRRCTVDGAGECGAGGDVGERGVTRRRSRGRPDLCAASTA